MNSAKRPVVSIVIPTYNRPKLVLRAVDSVLRQTYPDFEVIVMDDSRNEDTAEAMKQITDPRVRYCHNAVRLDFAENKNQGIRNANKDARYVGVLDDDDEYLPGFLAATVKKLDENKDIFSVTTYAEFKTQAGEMIKIYPCEAKSWQITMGNGWVFRREVFFVDGIWYDKDLMSEDLDLGIAVAQKHKWSCIPEVHRIYYGYPVAKGDSHSTSFTKETPTHLMTRFLDKNLEFYKRSGPEALAWAYFGMGKMLCRSNKAKEGGEYFWKAWSSYHRATYLFYYLLARLWPSLFGNIRIIILKNKLVGKIQRFR